MRRLLGIGALTLIVLLLATACDGGTTGVEPRDSNGDEPASVSGFGPGISVSEALESTLAGPLLVNGFIITTPEGTVYLSEALAESLPPQPVGEKLVVEGLDLNEFEGLTSAQGITWSDQIVQVLGDVQDGVLTVSVTASS
ncbi:MAG: hypothetical protein ACE5MI_02815 [Acidimicrobiia bacterium]